MTWPVSDEFKAALVQSHTPTMKVEVLENGLLKASSEIIDTVEHLDILDGAVDDDRKADVGRRTVSWTVVADPEVLLPLVVEASIYPLVDRDVRLWRGIGTELVPLATVQLETLNITYENGAATFDIGGTDRSKLLAGADWRTVLTIDEGTTPREATEAILDQVDPAHTYVIADAPTTKALDAMTFVPGEDPDPWEAIRKIWEAAVQEAFFDQLGQVKTQPIPDPATAPVAWEFLDDAVSLRLDPLKMAVDRANIRNGAVVKGSAPWATYGVYAEAWDTDPTSSTYYDPANPSASRVGPHPETISDSLVSDNTEAQTLADAKLPNILGVEEQLEFHLVPNPSLEAGDVIVAGNDLIGDPARFVMDQLHTPLIYDGEQDANTRRRRR